MAGVTHTAFRRLLRELGFPGLLSTEMLSARALPREDREASPYLRATAAEQPLSYQLLVAAPEEIPPAVEALQPLGPAAVDLNMGCPAPEARKRGGGSRLMEREPVARAIVAEARRRTDGPLTAKIRLGETLDEPALREFCRMLEGEGVDLLTVHARLRGEPYGRKPRWEWVGKVKSWVGIPVVANGGLFDAEDARRCLQTSACDGLMLGRGAAVKPWLFEEISTALWGAEAPNASPARPAVYFRYVSLLQESFAPHRQLGRLKQFTHYFSLNYSFGHNLATGVQSSRTVGEAVERAERFFARNEDADPRASSA